MYTSHITAGFCVLIPAHKFFEKLKHALYGDISVSCERPRNHVQKSALVRAPVLQSTSHTIQRYTARARKYPRYVLMCEFLHQTLPFKLASVLIVRSLGNPLLNPRLQGFVLSRPNSAALNLPRVTLHPRASPRLNQTSSTTKG